jgi:putative Holliday junction resolvase
VNTSYDRTFLGIDYGDRRVGVAKSDPTGLIASPVTTLTVKSMPDAVNQLLRLIEEYEPDGLVVGYPVHDTGEKSEKCREVDRFIQLLAERFDRPIHTIDESFTSQEAVDIIHAHGKKAGKKKERVDKLAAVLLLQRYLDEQR